MKQPDVFGIVANVLTDKVLRAGAKVWIRYCNGDGEKPLVVGLSKGGRRVRKYSNYKRLTNFRAAWVPEHARPDVVWTWATKEEAQAEATKLCALAERMRHKRE